MILTTQKVFGQKVLPRRETDCLHSEKCFKELIKRNA